MYSKNLSCDVRLRLSALDRDFILGLAEKRSCSVSECIRSIIGEYRRSLSALDVINRALENMPGDEAPVCFADMNPGGDLIGDIETDFDNKL